MDYPSMNDPWSGYLVIQAKFLQRGWQHADQSKWAIDALKGELEKFANKQQLRKPEYYIFATNAVFSGVVDSGGIDRADAVLAEYKEQLGLRGWRVWHHDVLCRFLDAQEEIRQRYLAFISSGDVLARILSYVTMQQTEFVDTITNYLQKHLLRDQFIRLGQAGYSTDDKTSLARVFIDLPAFKERMSDPPNESLRLRGALPCGFVSEVLDEGAQLLDFQSVASRQRLLAAERVHGGEGLARRPSEGHVPAPEAEKDGEPRPGRYVLVGGPGEGKTTVGQYIAQVYRSAILNDRREQLTEPSVRAIEGLIRHWQLDGNAMPSVRRYPIRVVLSAFASALATGSCQCLLSFILNDMSRVTAREVGEADLRKWLKAFPWILILDGLDEVPASSNRSAVLEKIDEIFVDLAQCNSDVLILATTRPQGYGQEFSPKDFRHRYLAPLSPERSKMYARRLLEARHVDDPELQSRVLTSLDRAILSPTTGRLMRTPLQVTIMAVLAERVGDPPNQRWGLFRRYFDIVYERELEKGGPTAEALRDHRQHIEVIHQRVGLRLQIESEQQGGTDSLLSVEGLILERLVEVGHDTESASIADIVISAAMERLVLLVSPLDGRVGFEIRSIQEFMAADCLMAGSEAHLRSRLRRISPSAHWRNVVLFAAGHWIARQEASFDTLLTICDELNDSQDRGRAGLEGSRLALELLEDGLASDFPSYARLLADKALRLLRLPPDAALRRLASVISQATERPYIDRLRENLCNESIYDMLSSYVLAHHMAQAGNEAARSLLTDSLPTDAFERLEVLRAIERVSRGEVPLDEIQEITPLVTYHALSESELARPLTHTEAESRPSWFVALSCALSRMRRDEKWLREKTIRFSTQATASVSFISVGDGPHRLMGGLAELPQGHPAWDSVRECGRFATRPSRETLENALGSLAVAWKNKEYVVTIPSGYLPWPLQSCLNPDMDASELEALARRAAAGDLGDSADWEAAEARWGTVVIGDELLSSLGNDRWPYNLSLLESGFPVLLSLAQSDDRATAQVNVEAWLTVFDGLPQSRFKSVIADAILDWISGGLFGHPLNLPTAQQVRGLLRSSRRKVVDLGIFRSLEVAPGDLEDWTEVLDTVGQGFRALNVRYGSSELPRTVAALRTISPARQGLRTLSATLALLGYASSSDAPVPAPGSGDTDELLLLANIVLPGFNGQDPNHLIMLTESLVKDHPYFINEVADRLTSRGMGDATHARFLEQLLPAWPGERWLSKQRAIEFIRKHLEPPIDVLGKLETRRWLGLPALGML
jgi:hypothetical protein